MPTFGVLVLRYASANFRSVPASILWVITVTVVLAALAEAVLMELVGSRAYDEQSKQRVTVMA